jgi:hypothetical protein
VGTGGPTRQTAAPRAGWPSALQTCSKTPLLAGLDPHPAGRRDGPSWMASVTRAGRALDRQRGQRMRLPEPQHQLGHPDRARQVSQTVDRLLWVRHLDTVSRQRLWGGSGSSLLR